MLDIKAIREHTDAVEAQLRKREPELSLRPLVERDERRRAIITEVERLKA